MINSGGIFDAIVQAKLRQIDEFVYEDRTGATARQKVPGMFKWEVTPGYWLLKVIWDFFITLIAAVTYLPGQRDATLEKVRSSGGKRSNSVDSANS